jgi:hypothetical protein
MQIIKSRIRLMGQTTPQSHIRPFGLESIEVGIRVQTWTHLLDMRLWGYRLDRTSG